MMYVYAHKYHKDILILQKRNGLIPAISLKNRYIHLSKRYRDAVGVYATVSLMVSR